MLRLAMYNLCCLDPNCHQVASSRHRRDSLTCRIAAIFFRRERTGCPKHALVLCKCYSSYFPYSVPRGPRRIKYRNCCLKILILKLRIRGSDEVLISSTNLLACSGVTSSERMFPFSALNFSKLSFTSLLYSLCALS